MTPLREHRLRDIRSSTGSPPPPPLRDLGGGGGQHLLQLPWRLLAESLALAAASTDAALGATSATAARALAAASDLAARSAVEPLRSAATRACASSFGAAGAAAAALEVSARLAGSATQSVADMLLPLSFVWNQLAACVRLAGVLLTYLGWSGLWLIQALRLVAYSLLLLPGFARVGLFYFTSKRVARGVRYGPRPRNTADLYVPPGCGFSAAELAAAATAAVARATAAAAQLSASSPKDRRKLTTFTPPEVPAPFSSPAPRPVVVYVTGGAWLIGHRAWGSLLAARLSAAAGAVVLCLDYRNFPQAGAGGAAEDVGAGIGWAVAALDVLSGVPRREPRGGGGGGKRGRGDRNSSATTNTGGGSGVVVVGQSAGAHLAALAILSRCAAAEGVVLPCVASQEAAARMMGAAAAANALSPGAAQQQSPSPNGGGFGGGGSSGSSSSSTSVDVEVDATDNAAVVILSAPPNAASSSSSRPESSSSLAPTTTAAPKEKAKPKSASLQRHPSPSLSKNPLHLPSLADAAATLGACDPRSAACFPPPVDPPEWVPSFSAWSPASPSPPSSSSQQPSSSFSAGGGDVAAFVGVSGVYDVASLAPHLARRGLRPKLLERIMSLPVTAAAAAADGGEKDAASAAMATKRAPSSWRPALAELSPTVLLLDCLRRRREDEDAAAYLSGSSSSSALARLAPSWPARLPPTALLHGTADACAPASDAARFVEAARAAGARDVSLRLYDGETHTSPLIENPMRGRGRDALGADLAALVVAASASAAAAAARAGGGDGNGGGKRRNDASAANGCAAAAATTSATLLRTSSSSVIPAPPKQQQRLGAVDGGAPLCPAPLIAAAAAVCPF